MRFGNQSLVFTEYTPTGTRDSMGEEVLTPETVTAPGCRHRPLTFEEKVELQFDIATEFWRSTIPTNSYANTLRDKVLAVKNNDKFTVDGKTYQVIGGIRHHPDMGSRPFKATIISKRQHG